MTKIRRSRIRVFRLSAAFACLTSATWAACFAAEPTTAREYYERAHQHERAKRYDEALANLTKAIERDPKFTAAYFARSSLYSIDLPLERRDYANSAQDLTAFLEIAPNDFSARFNRALNFESLKEFDKAIEDYTRVLEGDTDFSHYGDGEANGIAHTLHYRGRAYQCYKKDYKKAVADYDEALRLDPKIDQKIDQLRYHRAQVYRELKDYAQADADFAAAHARDPKYSNVLNEWAWQLATCPDALFRDGRKALELATRAAESQNPLWPKTLDVLAASHAELGDFKEAAKAQRQAIDADGPKTVSLWKARQARLRLYEAGKPFRTE